jgi:hypothetical protein
MGSHLYASSEAEKARLDLMATRLTELNNTASQILIFLSFAIVAGVTLLTLGLEPTRKNAVSWALRWWVGAIFPTVIGIIPMKEINEGHLPWYHFMLWMRFVLMWCALICILMGAIQFFRAI